MNKNILIPLVILITGLFIKVQAQSTYEKGYYIDNEDNRTECLILNIDWAFNPTAIMVKTNEMDDPTQLEMFYLKEFQVYGYEKYIKAKIILDGSSNDPQKLTTNKFPEWEKRQVFLKVITEGPATLYSYQQNQLIRYFFSTGDSIKQLIYKRYLVKNDNRVLEYNNSIASNNDFRKQLMSYVPIWQADYNKIDYKLKDLTDHFNQYNINQQKSEGSEFGQQVDTITQTYNPLLQNRDRKTRFSIGPVVSYQYTSWSVIDNRAFKTTRTHPVSHGIRLGISTEIVIPYYHNVWSFLMEPSFSINKGDHIRYTAFSFPLGIRYTIPFAGRSKFYVETLLASGAFERGNVEFTSTTTYEDQYAPRTCFVVGAGMKISTRKDLKNPKKSYLRIGAQYNSREDAFGYYYCTGKLQMISIMIGYNF